MTIRKGVEWGEEVDRPEGLADIADDRALHAFAEATGTQDVVPSFTVSGGALARTLGVDASAVRGAPRVRRLPIDRGVVVLDGEPHWFLAHLVIRRSWWRGPVIAVMNAEHLGEWDVAPRSHPNDGRLDVIHADTRLGIRQRLLARRRLRTGTHLPHPLITEKRVREADWTFGRPLNVWADGVPIGRARRIEVRVEPDAAAVFVG